MAWSDLVEKLIASGVLKTPKVVTAFNKVDRKDFVPEDKKSSSDADKPLPIGYGQTISQPTTVAFMIELLDVEAGQKVLDVGSGSGWTTAILAEIVGERGEVHSVEIIPQLVEFGKENVNNKGYNNTIFYLANGTIGLEKEAPFDRILASATAPEVPEELKDQLSEEKGRLVIPVGNITSEVHLIIKEDEKTYRTKKFPGFSFVPLKGKKGF
jgi:protein-L-isoaspartate(D-aspartate) O-methyltransferase